MEDTNHMRIEDIRKGEIKLEFVYKMVVRVMLKKLGRILNFIEDIVTFSCPCSKSILRWVNAKY
ncbi:MAG: hypothetical protein H8D26_02380 [Methanomicrobia archaeon]|nr:hypothetical protein [Methanomicrobia archaeon]